MWVCSKCDESIEDTFDACWNCGTYSDGQHNPDFLPEPDDANVPDPGRKREEERKPIRHFPPFRFSLRSLFLLICGLAVILGALGAPDIVAAPILISFSVVPPAWIVVRLRRHHDHPYIRAFYVAAFLPALLVALLTCVLSFLAVFFFHHVLPPDAPAEWNITYLERFANIGRLTGELTVLVTGGFGLLGFILRWFVHIVFGRSSRHSVV